MAQLNKDYGLRSGIKVDTITFRRSLLMNMVISSFSHARVMRSRDLFLQVALLAKQAAA